MILLMIVIAFISNAVMDASSENRFKSWWWNKSMSAHNKYEYSILGFVLPKFMRKKLIKFLLTTVFVFLTDGWHLAQFVFHSSWQLAVVWELDYNVFWSFLIVKTAFSGGFFVVYRYLKR